MLKRLNRPHKIRKPWRRPILCCICECPATDGGVPVNQLDVNKLSEWWRRTNGVKFEAGEGSDIEGLVVCYFCVWDARQAYENSRDPPDENLINWWSGHDTSQIFQNYYYQEDSMKRCKVELKRPSSKRLRSTSRQSNANDIQDTVQVKEEFVSSPCVEEKVTEATVVKKEKVVKDPHQCFVCLQSLPDDATLMQHMNRYHAGEFSACVVRNCFKVFQTEEEKAKHHMHVHLKRTQCLICHKDFDIWYLGQHMRRYHKDHNLFRCNYLKCSEYFTTEEDKTEHMLHFHENLIRCLFCPNTFESSYHGQHMRRCHKDLIRCTYLQCIEYFRTEQEQQMHMLNDHKSMTQCKFCPNSFEISYHGQHMRNSHKSLLRCTYLKCIEYFRTEEEKTNHMLNDHKNLVQCKFCPNIYETSYHSQHMRRCHKDLLRCTYQQCIEYFNTEDERQTHIGVVHISADEDRLKTKCNFCDLYFFPNYLPGHLKSVHQSQFQHLLKCTFNCSKYFLTEHELNEHIDSAHERYTIKLDLECVYCNKMCFGKLALQRHVRDNHRKQMIGCQVVGCIQYFCSQTDLKEHFEQVHRPIEERKKFRCANCDYRSVSKDYLRSHLVQKHGVKDKKCPECGKLFRSVSMLRAHVRLHYAARQLCLHCNLLVANLQHHHRPEKCSKCCVLLLCTQTAKRHHLQCSRP